MALNINDDAARVTKDREEWRKIRRAANSLYGGRHWTAMSKHTQKNPMTMYKGDN